MIYQRALAYEMRKSGIGICREIEQDIYYKKDLQEPIGTRRADFVVENKVLVELKSLNQIRKRCSSGTSFKLFKSLSFENRLINQLQD